jgi:hypothetical protein
MIKYIIKDNNLGKDEVANIDTLFYSVVSLGPQ